MPLNKENKPKQNKKIFLILFISKYVINSLLPLWNFHIRPYLG